MSWANAMMHWSLAVPVSPRQNRMRSQAALAEQRDGQVFSEALGPA